MIKRVILTVIYPVWFFLSKTWLGNMLMIPITIGMPMLPFYSMLNQTVGEKAQSMGIGLAILDMLLLAPIMFGILLTISLHMEDYYEKRGWKIEMETGMI